MKKIKLFNSFDEMEEDEITYLSSLSLEERLNLFFKIMKLSKAFSNKEKSLKKKRKIEIRYDYRFW